MRPVLNEKGQGLVEYALILVMIAIVVFVVLALLGPQVGNLFTDVNSEIEDISFLLGAM
ncbi:MAG: pilus assembly protein [Chloroflexi bacterium]|nr:pilus assembly protein [Chloroflexota bacterium]